MPAQPHHHVAPLLVAVAVGLVAYLAVRRRQPTSPVPPLEGFAGWLGALAALQWLAVLHAFGDLVLHFNDYQHHVDTPSHNRYWQIGFAAALVLQALLLAFALWSAIMMMRKSRIFPGLFRIELVLLVVFPLVAAVLLTWLAGHMQLPRQVALVYWVRAAIIAPFAGAAFLYSLRSVRFRNTFIHQEMPKVRPPKRLRTLEKNLP